MNTQLGWGCMVFQVKLSIVCVSKRRHPGKSPYGLNYSAAYPPPWAGVKEGGGEKYRFCGNLTPAFPQ